MHDFETLKDMHVTSIVCYLILYTVKVILLVTNKIEALNIIKQRAKIAEILLPILFIGTGVYMLNQGSYLYQLDKAWFFIKMITIISGIVLGIIAFKKENKFLAIFSLILFLFAYQFTTKTTEKWMKVNPSISNSTEFNKSNDHGNI